MFTIQDYLDSLKSDKQALVTNLTTKGISCSDSETFTTLVPKVLDIITVNNQTKSETITTNTTTTITPDTGYTGLSSVEITTNISLDLSNYYTSSLTYGENNNAGILKSIKRIPDNFVIDGTTMEYMFKGCSSLIEIPLLDTSNVSSMFYCFRACAFTTIPLLNTSNVTDMGWCFYECRNLETVPALNTSNVTSFRNCFQECGHLTNVPVFNWSSISGTYGLFNSFYGTFNSLTDTSLDNILQSCITVTASYTSNKDLKELFNKTFNATEIARIEALPHYNDFITAGWTINR